MGEKEGVKGGPISLPPCCTVKEKLNRDALHGDRSEFLRPPGERWREGRREREEGREKDDGTISKKQRGKEEKIIRKLGMLVRTYYLEANRQKEVTTQNRERQHANV